jgi:hypothetical protein
MTYGVDQCRVCGTRISPKGPEAAEEQEKANRRPIMPEKEWRRKGFLAPPTKAQIYVDPSNGCCAKCGMMVLRKHSKFGVITFSIAAVFLLLCVFGAFIITYLPH